MRSRSNPFYIFLLLTVAVLVSLLVGCGLSQPETDVDKIEVIGGNEQFGPPGTECPQELCLEFLGPQRRGLFGGKGQRHPVRGVHPQVERLDGVDTGVEFIDPVSDAGGRVRATLRIGTQLGDQYLRISAADHPEVSRIIRIISGVRVTGAGQEAYCNSEIPEPIRVTVYDANGRPEAGMPVYFTLVASPESKSKAVCIPKQAVTDANGIAETRVRLGEETGIYRVLIEVGGDEHHVRGIEVPVYGRNLWGLTGLIVSVLGGLAIFVFGMKSMSDGLQLVAGEKMKQILQFVTRNRVAAVLAGTAVTGVIQSSSACTVMTVGFVNAGLLNLEQAIGIVFGANIGTTVTAQILSFNVAVLALPAITVGLLIILLSRRAVPQGWGQTLLGFGMLFFGMEMMNVELKQVAVLPSVTTFFQSFDCTPGASKMMPFGAVLGALGIGTLMTMIIQSSSATIGIVLALGASGLINFYTAVPLVLGSNIGTTITANLAAIGTNQPARQTGIAHFLFNALGTLFILPFLFIPWGHNEASVYLHLIDYLTPGNVFAPEPENITRHIAMAHTMFNVCAVLLFIPLIPRIAAVCRWIIPEPKETPVRIHSLEPHLLNTPSIALEQVIASIRQMTAESWNMIREATEGMFLPGRYEPEAARVLAEREEAIDLQQNQVIDYLVQLSTRRLTEPQAEIIPLLMHCVNDAERIADHAENIVALAERLTKAKNKLSEDAQKDLVDLWHCLNEQAEHVLSGLRRTGQEDVILALLDEKRINKLSTKLEKSHVTRMKKGRCKVTVGIIFLEMVGELEKVGDHFTNIADRTPEIQKHHLAMRD